MALGREFLKAMDISSENIQAIIDAHMETVDALKAQVDEYKKSADKLKDVQRELDEANASLAAEKKQSWKVKYDALKEEYESYKSDQQRKETHEAKEEAYKALLREAGIAEKRIPAVLKVSAVDDAELDENGTIKDSAKLLKEIKEEWEEFIPTKTQEGANTPKPPENNGGGTMSKDEIFKIKDPIKRQDAIAKNIELFQKTGKDD